MSHHTTEPAPTQGIDFGPYDITDVTPADLDALRTPDPTYPVVRTQHAWLRVPAGTRCRENTRPDGVVDGLSAIIPGTPTHEAFTATVAVFAAPTDYNLWAKKGHDIMVRRFLEQGGSVEMVPTVWGDGLLWNVPDGHQSFFVIGADGPRWAVRVTAYGPFMGAPEREAVMDILNSCVIYRGTDPQGPGQCLNLSLLANQTNTQPGGEPM